MGANYMVHYLFLDLNASSQTCLVYENNQAVDLSSVHISAGMLCYNKFFTLKIVHDMTIYQHSVNLPLILIKHRIVT